MMGLEGVKEFIETKKEHFRYATYVDNADEYVRDRKLHFCLFVDFFFGVFIS